MYVYRIRRTTTVDDDDETIRRRRRRRRCGPNSYFILINNGNIRFDKCLSFVKRCGSEIVPVRVKPSWTCIVDIAWKVNKKQKKKNRENTHTHTRVRTYTARVRTHTRSQISSTAHRLHLPK